MNIGSLLVLISFIGSVAGPRALAFDVTSAFSNVERLVSAHQHEAGLATLQSFPLESLSPEEASLWAFGAGVLHSSEERWAEAKEAFQQSLKVPNGLEAIAHYHLGLVEKNLGQLDAAQFHLNQALRFKPSEVIHHEIRLALGDVGMARKRYSDAYAQFRYLQQRWKWSDRYPYILKRLVEVDTVRKKRWRACRWARNLYRNFPAHPAASDWSIDLHNVVVGGQKLGCLASFNDQQRRIRRLQWGGQSPRAREEIDVLVKRSSASTRYPVDLLLANFLMNEGFVEESLQVLLKYHSSRKRDFEYMMLLGTAAAKAGRFQTAVGSYTKAHALKGKNTSDAREALFKAAFLSYQVQDYDGAYRKFEWIKKLYPHSMRAHDASWHMAWLKYLRSDYTGAISDFKSLHALSKRKWRYRKNYPLDRVRYWLGMSYYRSGQPAKAKYHFSQLVKADPYGYYAQAAKHRLRDLPAQEGPPLRDLAEESEELASADTSSLGEAKGEDSDFTSEAADDVKSSEDQTVKDLSENEVPVDDKEGLDVADNQPEGLTDPRDQPVFSSQTLQDRFERAKKLIQLGFYDWARWELYSIEQKTRSQEHRKSLVELYERIKSFNRSAYIASIHFSEERSKRGLDGSAALWKAAYPMAYKDIVNHFSSEFGMEKEFVWAIMRAESFFKADVSSPVGAKGLMQLMPHTASQVSRLLGDETFDTNLLTRPEVNVRIGTRYLQRLSKKFKGQIPLMAAGYNAGPHRVESWLSNFGHLEMDEFIEHIPFKETRSYVKKVTTNYAIYKQLYAQELDSVAWINKVIDVPPNIQHSARETWEKL